MTNDKIRDYIFKKNIIRCAKCYSKLYYLNSTHHCIVYEPCSLEAQDEADEIDEINNHNNTGIYMCGNMRYTLNYDIPLQKCLPIPQIDARPQTDMYKRFECKYCGQIINRHQQETHQATKRCQKIKAKYYRE